MRLYFDLDLGKLVASPGSKTVLSKVEFKRGDDNRLELHLCRGSLPVAPVGTPTEMIFVVKKAVTAGMPSLLLANTWVSSEAGLVWTAPLVSLPGLETELSTANFKDLLAEFTFTDEGGGPYTSQTISARVSNDLWKGTEGTAVEELDPAAWLAAELATELTKLDGIQAGAQVNVPVLAFSSVPTTEAAATGSILFANGAYTIFAEGNSFTIGSTDIVCGTDILLTGVASDEEIIDQLVTYINTTAPGDFEVTAAKTSANLITFTAKASGSDGNSITLGVDFSGTLGYDIFITAMGGGSPAVTGIPGQSAIVTHVVEGQPGTQTEWGCVSISPMTWLPRTAGIIQKSDGLWYRQTLAADDTIEFNLLPNQ